jgi:GAF domain-containing protein
LQRGYRASAAFPIRVGGRVIGTFNLYADSADLFDAVELHLLDELALDLGFALEFIEAETELHRQRDHARPHQPPGPGRRLVVRGRRRAAAAGATKPRGSTTWSPARHSSVDRRVSAC